MVRISICSYHSLMVDTDTFEKCVLDSIRGNLIYGMLDIIRSYFFICCILGNALLSLSYYLSSFIHYLNFGYYHVGLHTGQISNKKIYLVLVSATPGMSYLFTVISNGLEGFDDVLAVGCVYFFIIFCAYVSAKFLHRYFFMRANMKYVTYQPISNKKRKKLIKQGVEIK